MAYTRNEDRTWEVILSFEVDSRIHASSFWLGDWPLSRVYLKNDANFPWVILVPRVEKVQEIHQLVEADRQQLMNEITMLSNVMSHFFKPDKLNVGALGNIVPQLHIHIVARFKTDTLWPHGVWQFGVNATPYQTKALAELIQMLGNALVLALPGDFSRNIQ